LTNNQKEKIFSNKYIQNFLENDPKVTLKNRYKFAEIAASLAYYLKSFSNINKLLDYICLIFKHIFEEKIILVMPLNYEGQIWNENIKISANNEFLQIEAFCQQSKMYPRDLILKQNSPLNYLKIYLSYI